MVWIVALSAAWFGAFVMLIALTTVAARSDRPTAEHLARTRARASGYRRSPSATTRCSSGPPRSAAHRSLERVADAQQISLLGEPEPRGADGPAGQRRRRG